MASNHACRSCKRVVFETLVKRTPNGLQRLTVPEIKQIGGRAGRYRSAGQQESSKTDESNVGFVTSLEEIDLSFIRAAMSTEPPPLTAAGIFPPDVVLHKLGAFQVIQVLGLRQLPLAGEEPWQAELRRRRFWACYSMECHSAPELHGIYAIFDQGNMRFGCVQRKSLTENVRPSPLAQRGGLASWAVWLREMFGRLLGWFQGSMQA